jgi:hypothetical protein
MSDKLREKKTKEVRGTFIEKYLGGGEKQGRGKERRQGKDKSVWMCVCVRERERESQLVEICMPGGVWGVGVSLLYTHY